MAMDIAIIGIGLHPFGRHDGVGPLDMGIHAAKLALADAGLAWTDVHLACAGSLEVLQPDTMNKHLGLTGIPITTLFNGCATGGEPPPQRGQRDPRRGGGRGSRGRPRQAPPGSVLGRRQHGGPRARRVVRRDGPRREPPVLRHEDEALHARPRDHRGLPEPGRGQGLRQRRPEPPARGAAVRSPTRRSPNPPWFATPSASTTSAPPARERRPWCCARADVAKRYTSKPIYLKADVFRTRLYGSFEVLSPCKSATDVPAPPTQASTAAFEMAGIGPEDIDVAQLQDTEVGHEIMHMAENGFCADGEQERWIRDGETEIGGKLPINTDGGASSPTASPWGPRASARSTRSASSSAGRPATARSRAPPGPATPRSTGSPGSARSRSSSASSPSTGAFPAARPGASWSPACGIATGLPQQRSGWGRT